MNKRLMMLVALLVVFAVVSSGMTMSWFTAESNEEASFIAGTVALSSGIPYAIAEGIIDDNWNPGDCDCFRVIVCNDGSKDIVVRAKIEHKWQIYSDQYKQYIDWDPNNPSVALSEAAIFDCPAPWENIDEWLETAITDPGEICCFTVRGHGATLYYINCLNQLCCMDDGAVVGEFDPTEGAEALTIYGEDGVEDFVIDANTLFNDDGEVYAERFGCYISFNKECWEPVGEFYYYVGGENFFCGGHPIDPVLDGYYDPDCRDKQCVGLCLPVYFNHMVDNDYQGKKLKLKVYFEAVQAANNAPEHYFGSCIPEELLNLHGHLD
ncbi:hypothetical protein SAMN02745751_00313 [Dethiosulfatibacter aminovorans DSM 17477]|uniref:SipW-cognate class signal peptide n=1 Tax=Dethiosulfatibacter aminovorans DSM 17477 TaxID=1121476 RepID=A0A1M6B174_9FIRM|nr:hypothetical protein [Dethiosulfatibacter aminovorans]SHI42223.1 hypothetical protein SAMN02745751_00313 [Dethiosulfatibacter aminovorans DSM 17477]